MLSFFVARTGWQPVIQMLDLVIRNAIVVTERAVERADIAIENESIVEISPSIAGGATEEIDATNLHAFPGVIDPHVHFNEPGRTDWEGITTGSSAFAAGGGTLYFDMPLNSSPPVLDGESFDAKLELAKRKSFTDFALWGGLTPANLDKLEELADRGVVGFKAFMCDSGIDDFPNVDLDALHRGMQIAAKLKLPVAVHAEDPRSLAEARARVTGHSWADYLASRPVVCESIAVRAAIECAKDTDCSLHVVHVSSPLVLDVITFARDQGVDVTCETCPHYFLLSQEDLPIIGARAKCSPPLRERSQCGMMVVRLRLGDIDFVTSDHSPAPPSMKQGDDAFAIWGGIAGVQSTLGSLLTRWMDCSYPFRDLPALIAGKSAARFRIARKGTLAPGNDADLVLVDTNDRFTLTRDMLLDRHQLSPYVGREFRGRIVRTILRGQTVFENGRIVGNPRGQFVRPSYR